MKTKAKCKKDSNLILTNLDHSRTIDSLENPGNQSTIFNTVDPFWYCGGANELDMFRETLRSNFASHNHQFPKGDHEQVKDAVCFLETWNNHPDMTQLQMERMYPGKLASNLREGKGPCLDDFKLFSSELHKVYAHQDRHLNPATNPMQKYQQPPNEAVVVYAKRSKPNWTRAGWNLMAHEVFLLRHGLHGPAP